MAGLGTITLLGCTAMFASSLAAQPSDPHAAQPERPTVATHAGTVAPGWLELETGIEYDHFSDRPHGVSLQIFFKTGVGRRVQLGVSLPQVAPSGGTLGFGDAAVSLKWRVREGGGILGDFALLPSLKVPTGSSLRGRGTGTTDVSLLLVSSHSLGVVAMDLNAGITRRSGDGSDAPRTATVWTASFGGPARGALGWVAELYGYPKTTGPAGTPNIVALLAGPTLKVRPWLVLDAGGIVPVDGAQPKALYAGLTLNAGRY
jgi:hypothetical protein